VPLSEHARCVRVHVFEGAIGQAEPLVVLHVRFGRCPVISLNDVCGSTTDKDEVLGSRQTTSVGRTKYGPGRVTGQK
jgi:hypothetical protein